MGWFELSLMFLHILHLSNKQLRTLEYLCHLDQFWIKLPMWQRDVFCELCASPDSDWSSVTRMLGTAWDGRRASTAAWMEESASSSRSFQHTAWSQATWRWDSSDSRNRCTVVTVNFNKPCFQNCAQGQTHSCCCERWERVHMEKWGKLWSFAPWNIYIRSQFTSIIICLGRR